MDMEFTGACTIAQVDPLKAKLLGLLAGAGKLVVSFKGVTEVDLSFFLLLHAAKRSFLDKGKELVLLADLPARLAEKARWSGLPEIASPEAG